MKKNEINWWAVLGIILCIIALFAIFYYMIFVLEIDCCTAR